MSKTERRVLKREDGPTWYTVDLHRVFCTAYNSTSQMWVEWMECPVWGKKELEPKYHKTVEQEAAITHIIQGAASPIEIDDLMGEIALALGVRKGAVVKIVGKAVGDDIYHVEKTPYRVTEEGRCWVIDEDGLPFRQEVRWRVAPRTIVCRYPEGTYAVQRSCPCCYDEEGHYIVSKKPRDHLGHSWTDITIHDAFKMGIRATDRQFREIGIPN